MNFLELATTRYSARNYSLEPVEQSKLDYILESARQAPSAVNYQPWHFIVVRSEEYRRKLQSCYPRQWFESAPIYIVVCANSEQGWRRASDNKNHADIDAAIAAEHICLAATEQGLGSCWVCNFDPEIFRAEFPLSDSQYPVAIIPIGYVIEPPKQASSRKDSTQIVSVL